MRFNKNEEETIYLAKEASDSLGGHWDDVADAANLHIPPERRRKYDGIVRKYRKMDIKAVKERLKKCDPEDLEARKMNIEQSLTKLLKASQVAWPQLKNADKQRSQAKKSRKDSHRVAAPAVTPRFSKRKRDRIPEKPFRFTISDSSRASDLRGDTESYPCVETCSGSMPMPSGLNGTADIIDPFDQSSNWQAFDGMAGSVGIADIPEYDNIYAGALQNLSFLPGNAFIYSYYYPQ